jgi:hypothetical protein
MVEVSEDSKRSYKNSIILIFSKFMEWLPTLSSVAALVLLIAFYPPWNNPILIILSIIIMSLYIYTAANDNHGALNSVMLLGIMWFIIVCFAISPDITVLSSNHNMEIVAYNVQDFPFYDHTFIGYITSFCILLPILYCVLIMLLMFLM